jgi:phosphopantetheinyl transferase
MPLVYQQNINDTTKLGIWQITEPEEFFLQKVPLQVAITHPNKRRQHLAGRYLLQQLYPDFPYELIRIADTRKPFLENEAYHFSISHCGEYAAVMISPDYRVGVDIEKISQRVEKIKHKFLSPTEQQLLMGIPLLPYSSSSEKLLTAAWSIKEALFKWQGSQEVDFIKHLHINQLEGNEQQATAQCSMLKADKLDLSVQLLFFNDHTVAWVLKAAAPFQ